MSKQGSGSVDGSSAAKQAASVLTQIVEVAREASTSKAKDIAPLERNFDLGSKESLKNISEALQWGARFKK